MSLAAIPAWVYVVIVLVVIIIVLAALYFWGTRQQKKSDEAQKQLEAAAQPMTLLVIDKKRMPIRDSSLPKVVIDGVPKRMRRSKVPVVKAKAGSKIMTFMCDTSIFDLIPVKQEIRAMVGGIYILSFKTLRGSVVKPEKKPGFFKRLMNRFRSNDDD